MDKDYEICTLPRMIDLSKYPSRVTRAVAMELLSIDDKALFTKVVDANPELIHRLPGETRARYRTSVIADLLSGLSNGKPGVRPLSGSGRIHERPITRRRHA